MTKARIFLLLNVLLSVICGVALHRGYNVIAVCAAYAAGLTIGLGDRRRGEDNER